MMEQGQSELQKIQEKPTIEQVLRFLKDNRSVAFTLDIETDRPSRPTSRWAATNEFIQVLAAFTATVADDY
jgi:hypothetical protein